jgi:hypothetical protein
MCWLLAAVAVGVLVGVDQLHFFPLLHLVAVAGVVEEELNYGFLLHLLTPLRQSLLALVALVAQLKQIMTKPEMQDLMDQIHLLDHGRLQEMAWVEVVEQQQPAQTELVAAAWQKLLKLQPHIPHLAALETQQTAEPLVVEAIDPEAVEGLPGL